MSDDPQQMTSAEARLLDYKIGVLTEKFDGLQDTTKEIARSLSELVALQQQQRDFSTSLGRAFDEVKRIEAEVTLIDKGTAAEFRRVDSELAKITGELPAYRELRRWVIGGVLAGAGMLAASILSMMFIKPMQDAYSRPESPTTTVPEQYRR